MGVSNERYWSYLSNDTLWFTVGKVGWLLQHLQVKQFLEVSKMLKIGIFSKQWNYYFWTLFQKATILRPIDIMTWNPLSVTLYFLNFMWWKHLFNISLHFRLIQFWKMDLYWTFSSIFRTLQTNKAEESFLQIQPFRDLCGNCKVFSTCL